MNSRYVNWLFGYQALVYALALLLVTGLVMEWGAWYSASVPYRKQTEAFFHGDLAVSRSVADLTFDYTWSEQGVHQVWGLGVPLWRMPFEGVAKLCGHDGFPDRLAFGFFALLVGFVALKVWVGETYAGSLNNSVNSNGWAVIMRFGASFLILLLFPPLFSLLQSSSRVYEEAVAYEYLYGILQVTLLVAFVRRPTIGRFLLACALAGFGGLIRPTLVFYGFATVVLATVVWIIQSTRWYQIMTSSGCSRLKQAQSIGDPGTTPVLDAPTHLRGKGDFSALSRLLASAGLGLFLFLLGCGVLWWTNLKRFGDGFEFGHKLNVQTLYGSMYATRFDDPYQDEPLSRAARELFGALFLNKTVNGSLYQENIFPGQSPTVRWRQFYFRTYDWIYPPLLLLGWGASVMAAWAFWRKAMRRSKMRPSDPSPVGSTPEEVSDLIGTEPTETSFARSDLPARGRTPAQQTDGVPMTERTPEPIGNAANPIPPCSSQIPYSLNFGSNLFAFVILGLWSLLAVIPLVAFYLYVPVISSRYMMDFAPAFASAIASAWLFLASRCNNRWSRVLVCLLLCAWIGKQFSITLSGYANPTSVTAAEVKKKTEKRSDVEGSTTKRYSANNHGQSLNSDRSDIPHDCVGWNPETGAVMPLVILFVQDPEFLELDLATQPHPSIQPDPETIRAKVGLEFLERAGITEIEGGWRVRFRGPQQPRWRDGLQSGFVATVPKEFLAERTTPWILRAVRWRDKGDEGVNDIHVPR